MANLRDKGYGNSMEGMQLKKERHAREKTVTPGEATVQKGQTYQPTRFFEPVTDYKQIAQPAYGQSSQPLGLHYSNLLDQTDHYFDVEIPHRNAARDQAISDYAMQSLSDEQIKRRMKELEQAMSAAYSRQNAGRAARRGIQTGEEGHYPEEIVANSNWEAKEWLNDWTPDVTTDPVASFLAQTEFEKAAAAGKEINAEALRKNLALQEAYPGKRDALNQMVGDAEKSIDELYFEYNNLKNEYNTRLARYLQSIGG